MSTALPPSATSVSFGVWRKCWSPLLRPAKKDQAQRSKHHHRSIRTTISYIASHDHQFNDVKWNTRIQPTTRILTSNLRPCRITIKDKLRNHFAKRFSNSRIAPDVFNEMLIVWTQLWIPWNALVSKELNIRRVSNCICPSCQLALHLQFLKGSCSAALKNRVRHSSASHHMFKFAFSQCLALWIPESPTDTNGGDWTRNYSRSC